jgi:PAT family acetyl-CoA transporter-like MFS transporter 1
MTKSVKNKNGSEEFTISLEFATEKPNLSGDWMNFFLLMLLYIIQGFPKGFAIGFSIILQSKKLVNYEDQVS